jgi:hypothetical protein
VSLHELTEWHDTFVSVAQNALKSRPEDEPANGEKRELLAKIGEITMANELLLEKIRRLENGAPFHLRR